MQKYAVFAAIVLLAGLSAPAFAYDNATSYNIKNAPPAQQQGNADENSNPDAQDASDKASDNSEGDLAPPKQELSTPQKEEAERRRINGEGSDIYHGDENSWPHHGRMN